MRRVSATLPDDVYRLLEELSRQTGITNRSRLISDAIASYSSKVIADEGVYAGAVVVLYDHSRGETVYAVVDAQHDYLDVIRSNVHLHVSRERCVEVLAVEGRGDRIKGLLSSLRRVSGVLTVQHSLIPLE